MINLISDFKIISQAQDYAIVGDGKVISSGLTKEEVNEYSRQLKSGEVVLNTVYKPSTKNIDLKYWKTISKYPLGDKHTLIPVKFIADMDMVNRTALADDNDWVFMSIGKTLISVVKLGNRRGINLPLKEFRATMDEHGVALACKLY